MPPMSITSNQTNCCNDTGSSTQTMDAITTPVLVRKLTDLEGLTPIATKSHAYQVHVTVIEVKHLQEINEQRAVMVRLELDGVHKMTTAQEYASSKVAFNETFHFDLKCTPFMLQEKLLTLSTYRVRSSHRLEKLLGSFRLDLSSVFAQESHAFQQKWAPLTSDENQMEITGYALVNISILPKEFGSMRRQSLSPLLQSSKMSADASSFQEEIQSNLIMPSGLNCATKHAVKYKLNIYRADRITSPKTLMTFVKSSLKGNDYASNTYISVNFAGRTGRTRICRHSRSPVWNECITFLHQFPPLCQYMRIHLRNSESKLTIASYDLNLQQISSINTDGSINFLPCFGPTFIYFYRVAGRSRNATSSKDIEESSYCGRLLISLETEILSDAEKTDLTITSLTTEEGATAMIADDDCTIPVSKSIGDPIKENLIEEEEEENEEEQEVKEDKMSKNAEMCNHMVNVQSVDPVDTSSTMPSEDEFLCFFTIYESNLIAKKFQGKKVSYMLEMGKGTSSPDSDTNLDNSDLASLQSHSLAGKDSWSSVTSIDVDSESLICNRESQADLSETDEPTVDTQPEPLDPSKLIGLSNSSANRSLPIKAAVVDRQCSFLPFMQTKQCLHIRRSFPDQRQRLFASNILLKTAEELEVGLIDVEALKSINRSSYSQRLSGVIQELIVGCNRFHSMSLSTPERSVNKLDSQLAAQREQALQAIADESEHYLQILTRDLYREVMAFLYQSLQRIRQLVNDPQPAFPDIVIWMMVEKRKIAFARMKCTNYVFSLIDQHRGKYTGHAHNVLLREIKSPFGIANRLQVHGWFGPVKYKRYFLDGLIKGYEDTAEVSNADLIDYALPRFLNYNTQQICQLRAHVYQAILSLFSNGLMNPFAKIIFNGSSRCTQIIEETLSPCWDVSIVIPEVILYGERADLHREPPTVTIEIYDRDSKTGKSYLLGFCFLKVNLRFEDESYTTPQLEWSDIWSDGELVGQLLAVVEVLQIHPDDHLDEYPALLPEVIEIDSKQQDEIYHIPVSIRPTLSRYRLEVLFWGLRDMKRRHFINAERPRIDIELAGYIISSAELISFKRTVNFANPLKSVDVYLPDQDIYLPPLTIRAVQRSFGALTLAGTHVVEHINKFIYFGQSEIDQQINQEKVIKLTVSKSEPIQFTDEQKSETDWWIRYRSSCLAKALNENERNSIDSEPKAVLPENLQIKLFDCELERSPEFGDINDWGLTSYPLYVNKRRYDVNSSNNSNSNSSNRTTNNNSSENQVDKSSDVNCIGIFKGSFQFYKYPIPGDDSNAVEMADPIGETSVMVRAYLIKADHLLSNSTGNNSKLQPYAVINVNGRRIGDRESCSKGGANPIIGKMFEFIASFPSESIISIQLWNKDRFGIDSLIGETRIDIENRFYSRHRLLVGLPRVYMTCGPSRWRDVQKPSEILSKLCTDLKYGQPQLVNDNNSFKLDSISFEFERKSEDRPTSATAFENEEYEQKCLDILNNWQKAFGFHLLPEHVETRVLYSAQKPGLRQGSVTLWLDLFPQLTKELLPLPIDIKPRRMEDYTLCVTIGAFNEVRLRDVTFLRGEPTGSIFVKGQLNGFPVQSTVKQKTSTGTGTIQWRFVFSFTFLPGEDKMIAPSKQSSKTSSQNLLPVTLSLQVWDMHQLSTNTQLASLSLDLNHIPQPAESPKQKASSMANFPEASALEVASDEVFHSLFDKKSLHGWWPLTTLKNEEPIPAGKIELSLELFDADDAKVTQIKAGKITDL